MRKIYKRSARLGGALVAFVTAASIATVAPPTNGPKHVDARWHALTGATAVVRPGSTIENATIVLRDGVIQSVAAGAAPPEGARVWDLTGLTIYPGFIEPFAEVKAPAPDKAAPGAHWRENVTPQRSALDGEGLTEKDRESLRALGFTAAAISPQSGLFKGTAALVSLADDADELSAASPRVIATPLYQSAAPETGGWGGSPPTSLMGAIAVFRQTFIDAGWYADAKAVQATSEPIERQVALEALGPNNASSTTILFDAENGLNALRMAKVAAEFERSAILLGSGQEYQHLTAIAALGLPLFIPLNFPDTPDVSSIAAAESVSLNTLMEWEQAPTNLRRLDAEGANIAITSHRLDKDKDFWPNLRSAVKTGLPTDRALAMLTTNTARILGAGDTLGTLEAGKLANLTVFSGDPFTDDKAELREVWTAGARHEINALKDNSLDGVWSFNVGDDWNATLNISDNAKAVKMEADDESAKARSVSYDGDRLSFIVDGDAFDSPGVYQITAVVSGNALAGSGVDPDGNHFAWSGTRQDADEEDADEDKPQETPDSDIPDAIPVPFGAYGWLEEPKQGTILVTGATIWTSDDAGIIENGALITRNGKIVYVGPASRTPRIGVDRTIDAKGKHITPGLFDAHSHMGISGGVNEGGQAVTAEVRIADVINPDDVAWYRALAGGLTTANQLHGSANPIGGQNSVVKLRWGTSDPEDFRFEGAIEGIKFALGENVKRSEGRYPDTRMGVETIIRDRFIAAQEYEAAHAAYENLGRAEKRKTVPPRRDIELDALVEILNSERLIHCHSYRQDEILMLCNVAGDFDFKIGTFQHVLEGYKVAEAIREHAHGGSCFSDWWAYKFEVYDAIPQNGAIMHEAGVTVSFNSDDNELARRMNTEAAKAVRYGGMDPAEALKFVTLNPARQFMVDDNIGSLDRRQGRRLRHLVRRPPQHHDPLRSNIHRRHRILFARARRHAPRARRCRAPATHPKDPEQRLAAQTDSRRSRPRRRTRNPSTAQARSHRLRHAPRRPRP